MTEEHDLDAITLIIHLNNQTPGTDKYDQALEELKNLTYIQKERASLKSPSKLGQFLNNPALIGGVVNLGISLLMLNFERTGVITSAVRQRIGR